MVIWFLRGNPRLLPILSLVEWSFPGNRSRQSNVSAPKPKTEAKAFVREPHNL